MREWAVAMALVTGLIAVSVAAVLWPVPSPPPEVRLYTPRSTYEIGDTVRFVLENRHTLSYCYGGLSPFAVYRDVAGVWKRVELYEDAAILSILAPGNSLGGGWRAETQRDLNREAYGVVEVHPGRYRVESQGALCARIGDESAEALPLYAYFTLTV